jgi:hypothetical protein
MTARVVEELPEGEQWIYEVKFDGYRACDEAVDVGARQIRMRLLGEVVIKGRSRPRTLYDVEPIASDFGARAQLAVLEFLEYLNLLGLLWTSNLRSPLCLFCTWTPAFWRISPIERFSLFRLFDISTQQADRLPPPPNQ